MTEIGDCLLFYDETDNQQMKLKIKVNDGPDQIFNVTKSNTISLSPIVNDESGLPLTFDTQVESYGDLPAYLNNASYKNDIIVGLRLDKTFDHFKFKRPSR